MKLKVVKVKTAQWKISFTQKFTVRCCLLSVNVLWTELASVVSISGLLSVVFVPVHFSLSCLVTQLHSAVVEVTWLCLRSCSRWDHFFVSVFFLVEIFAVSLRCFSLGLELGFCVTALHLARCCPSPIPPLAVSIALSSLNWTFGLHSTTE